MSVSSEPRDHKVFVEESSAKSMGLDKIQIRAFTEQISDAVIRYQVTIMSNSVFVWVQQNGSAESDGNTNQAPSLNQLAVSMPGALGYDGLPATTVLLGGRTNALGERLAARLARRTTSPVFASVDLGEAADVMADVVFKRVLTELRDVGVVHGTASQ